MANLTYIIAEAGVNHNGSLPMAKELINIAKETGANAVKFQTFKAQNLVTKTAPKAEYQLKTTHPEKSQFDMLKELELDEHSHQILIDYCHKKQIQFLSTPFDIQSLKLLSCTFNLPLIKISSGEITNAPLLLEVGYTNKQVILSTGMSSLDEVKMALSILAFGYLHLKEQPSIHAFKTAYLSQEGQRYLKKKISLLHCTSEYPAPFEEINLNAMKTMISTFGLPTGLSDHSLGIAVPLAAVACGATIIEKHFTLDKNLPGPDHKASLAPEELKDMIKAIRQIEIALGSSQKSLTLSELKNSFIVRKSLVASKNIAKGEKFSETNLSIKRPGTGLSPINYWEWLNKVSDRDYNEDDLIQ